MAFTEQQIIEEQTKFPGLTREAAEGNLATRETQEIAGKTPAVAAPAIFTSKPIDTRDDKNIADLKIRIEKLRRYL